MFRFLIDHLFKDSHCGVHNDPVGLVRWCLLPSRSIEETTYMSVLNNNTRRSWSLSKTHTKAHLGRTADRTQFSLSFPILYDSDNHQRKLLDSCCPFLYSLFSRAFFETFFYLDTHICKWNQKLHDHISSCVIRHPNTNYGKEGPILHDW